MFVGMIGRRPAARKRRSRAYIRGTEMQENNNPRRTHRVLILAVVLYDMATQFCSGRAILANRHDKSNAFVAPENGFGPLTI